MYYQRLDYWIMQSKSFHWLTHHGLSAIKQSIHMIFLGTFILISVQFLYCGGVFNKTILFLSRLLDMR